jgi:hypothetical protein
MNLKQIFLSFIVLIIWSNFSKIMSQPLPPYIPTNGLVGFFPFNGNANDISGNGNNGDVFGCIPGNDRFDNSNSALLFDGMDDGVELRSNLLPSTNSSYTISFWYKLNTFSPQPNGYSIFDDRDENTQNHKGRYFVNANQSLTTSNYLMGTNGPIISDTSGSTTQWIHGVCVYNSILQKIYLYKNGVNIDSINCAPSWFQPGNRNVQIGRSKTPIQYIPNSFFTGHFNGLIDDLGIWHRVLTETEIAQLFVPCQNNVSGHVYIDYNSDLIYNNGNEPTWPNTKIVLLNGCTGNDTVAFTMTNELGYYSFNNVSQGTYRVVVGNEGVPQGDISTPECCLSFSTCSPLNALTCNIGYSIPNCSAHPLSSDNCANAPQITNLTNLGNFPCSQNPNAYGSLLNQPNCNAIFENTHFYKFIAGEGNYNIDITLFDCTGSGLEFGLFTSCGDPVNSSISCNTFTNGIVSISSSILSPCQEYILWLDGINGSICSYYINITGDYNNCNDDDSDGISNIFDNCPNHYNPLQEDTDNDGIGNACDNCPSIPNPNQADCNNNGIGDLCDDPDQDCDGIYDAVDNCPTVYNPFQIDQNQNGIGDACEIFPKMGINTNDPKTELHLSNGSLYIDNPEKGIVLKDYQGNCHIIKIINGLINVMPITCP